MYFAGGGCDCGHNNPCNPLRVAGLYYYTHADPKKYVQCDAFGGCFVRPCAPGTAWSQEKLTCDHDKSSPCNPNPCKNGGTCSYDDDGGAVCKCPEGFEGDKCETETPGITSLTQSNSCSFTQSTFNAFNLFIYFIVIDH